MAEAKKSSSNPIIRYFQNNFGKKAVKVHVNDSPLKHLESCEHIKLSPTAFKRIKKDIQTLCTDAPSGIFVTPNEDYMCAVHAMIVGPSNTPYEGGFFNFIIICPQDYPIKPPRVHFITTSNGSVTFNPNLYSCGIVCLSIIGTWPGPQWSPVLSLSTLLVSIQSLLNEKPYHNEPGFEKEQYRGDSAAYNRIVQHETLRVAVCDILEKKSPCPEILYLQACRTFHEMYDHYVQVCTTNSHLNGKPFEDPFCKNRGVFDYDSILTRLENLASTIQCNLSTSLTGSASDSSPLPPVQPPPLLSPVEPPPQLSPVEPPPPSNESHSSSSTCSTKITKTSSKVSSQ